jgi:simple sugar transport system ATP-binding protein
LHATTLNARQTDRYAIDLSRVSKRFGATVALDEVDLAVRRGEVVALLGANGAGKSTLAKVASGVLRPDTGVVKVDGRPVELASPRDARAAGIVIVHQRTDQLGAAGLSVAENLVLDQMCGGGLGWLARPSRIRARAAAIAAEIGLELDLTADFATLGPARRQLVAIARAVAADASLLLLDEPTASLAASEAAVLFSVIDRLRARGVGVLYISHRMADIRRIADRLVVLRNGRVAGEQERPFDITLGIRQMIGRDLEHDRRAARPGAAAFVHIEQLRLGKDSAPFDLTIGAGEIVAIIGALGSGKSRFLRTLYGLEPLVSGTIALDGAAWRPQSPAKSVANGVFLAGEDRWATSLLPAATPASNIAGAIALPHRKAWFPGGVVDGARENRAAIGTIQALRIRCNGPSDSLEALSGGNQQKVVIGRWQAAPCRWLLLDEPFQGVDIGARRDLIDSLRETRAEGATLIAVSDVEEALECADRVAVMRDHTIVAVHDLDRGGAEPILESLSVLEGETDQQTGGSR